MSYHGMTDEIIDRTGDNLPCTQCPTGKLFPKDDHGRFICDNPDCSSNLADDMPTFLGGGIDMSDYCAP